MKYIGIDLGTKTMGIATSQGIISTVRETYRFKENNFNLAADYLKKLIINEKFDIVIIGYPKNMDNSIGHRAKMVDDFVLLLKKKFNNEINIELIDERLTTKIANNIMLEADLSRMKRKLNKDGLAAQIILNTYLQKVKKEVN